MTATVPETTAPRKPTAYYAQYLGLSGVLTRPAGTALFLEYSGAVISLSDEEVYREVVINGAVDVTMAQYLDDMARGGAVAISTRRQQEVA